MELVKDIYFNTDKLIENTKVKVSYTGKFYQGNNDKVFIHYGYGENWDNVNEAEMIKTDLGYQTELDLTGGNTINFCFKNQNNEWDNNCGNNYIFNIEKESNNELGKTTFGVPQENAGSFFGKTFGTEDGNQTVSNVYWNSNQAQDSDEKNSGIIEDTVLGNSDSVDTFIGPVQNAEVSQNLLGGIEVSNGTGISNLGTENLLSTDILNNGISTPVANNTGIETPIADVSKIDGTLLNNSSVSNNNGQVTTTAITVVNTGFEKTLVWTRKIKATVCKFFAYVPKFISGNYKRKVDNKNK